MKKEGNENMAYDDNGGVSLNMPVMPAYGGYSGMGSMGGFSGFGGDGWWLILLLLCIGNGGWGGFGGGLGNMMSYGVEFPWLLNGQSQTNDHISDGFRDAQISNQISDARSDINRGFGDVQLGISGLGRQICETGNSVSGAVRDGFYGAEVAAQGRHNSLTGQLYQGEINALNRSFQEQTANAQGFNGVQSSLCDIRYGNATNTRDIIENQTRVGQAILDKLCQLELDGVKNQVAVEQRENANLRTQLSAAQFAASQAAQTATFQQGLNNEVDALYNRLKNCPVNTVPVYGNQPIFTCPQNAYGCGCAAA